MVGRQADLHAGLQELAELDDAELRLPSQADPAPMVEGARATQVPAGRLLAMRRPRVPSAERKARWEKMASGGFSEQELGEAYERMADCLQKVDEGLKRGPWLAGRDFSLADIAMIPFVDRIHNLRPDLVNLEKLRRLVDWYQRMQDRPAFNRAFAFRDDPRAAELPNL